MSRRIEVEAWVNMSASERRNMIESLRWHRVKLISIFVSNALLSFGFLFSFTMSTIFDITGYGGLAFVFFVMSLTSIVVTGVYLWESTELKNPPPMPPHKNDIALDAQSGEITQVKGL